MARPRHPGRIATLAVGVLLAHLWLASGVLPNQLGEGSAHTPRRMDIRFERVLQQSAPPAAALAPAPALPRPRRAAAVPTPAASAPPLADPAAEAPAPEAAASAPPSVVAQPASAPALAVAAVDAAASAPAAVAATPPDATASAATTGFEWPPSTRLSYHVTGNYRGPVDGQAQVEWLRSGARYQVAMDISIGPAFAPLVRRRVLSDGEITPAGLHPRRYDEETKAVLASPRTLFIVLDEDVVRLPGANPMPRPAGVQDSASQFVQLTWLFTTQPQLLQRGQSIDIPLALPRRMETWTYDVIGPEVLYTPAGPVDTVHVKPRRDPGVGGDITAEMWVAPTLQYLPVRILIRQSAETFLDLNIEKLPEQAAERR